MIISDTKLMINIIIPCTPNYSNENIINTITKKIDMISQFIMLYRSIKKNWKSFDYRISLFHNKNIPFNKNDLKKLSQLDIDIFSIEPDFEKTPYMLRCNALTHKVTRKGSHRLLLDCDTIALNEPRFDLSCDWQAMFAGSVIEKKHYEYINKGFDYNIELENKFTGKLFLQYMSGKDGKDFFPHFNGGAVIMKEHLCKMFKEYTVPCYAISHDKTVPIFIRHIGVQYGASFALIKMSTNWKPFHRGFNFLRDLYDINKFGKENIKLFHYCGSGGDDIVHEYFPEYLLKK